MARRQLLIAAALAALAPPSFAARFDLETERDGIYRVSYESLAARDPDLKPTPSRAIGLRNRGIPVPIWIEGARDGVFGPGDEIEFRGNRLRGENSYNHPHAERNVYVLDTADTEPQRLRPLTDAPPTGATSAAPPGLVRHLEEDVLYLRFSGAGADSTVEQWYWSKLTHADAQPFRVRLDLPGLDRGSPEPVTALVSLQGWSRNSRGGSTGAPLKEHRVEATIAGRAVGRFDWDNIERPGAFLLAPQRASDLDEKATLELRVPPRATSSGETLIDVAVVNWIEVRYPWNRQLGGGQIRLTGASPGTASTVGVPSAKLRWKSPPELSWRVISDAGYRANGRGTPSEIALSVPGTSFDIAVGDEHLEPSVIERRSADTLRNPTHRADYLMVTTPELRAALEPLAAFHRGRGLVVETILISDIYDQFSHGIADPQALRDFLAFAADHWRAPTPRFVLLAGDASWDIRSAQPEPSQYPDAVFNPGHGTAFAGVESSSYESLARQPHRNLIPTWSYGTYDGHAAGDHWFVADPRDDTPRMAIGRMPVVDPGELRAVVEKTLRYAQSAPEGDWRRRVLWIANEDPVFQNWSTELATWMAGQGLADERFYPEPSAAHDPMVQDPEKLRAALDRGHLLVHFVGHGGRFIWRTGPADWTKHRDLFGLADIDRLQPTGRLPVVLSMTCYSAPFDHPTADSIGEKLLREPERGAIAVVAASWRNAPHRAMSETLLKAILESPTLGEALQRAKTISKDRDFRQQYNLLGDPALSLPLPTQSESTSP